MLYTNAQINNLLLNGTLDAAAAALREKIKAGHNHLEEDQIATRIAERESKSVSELELERSEPGLNALHVCSARRPRPRPPPSAGWLR